MPSKTPDPIILIDTREQRPLTLPNSRVATLKTGDYSVEGFTDRIAVERKSHADLYGCIAHDKGCTPETRAAGQRCGARCRFKAELERLAAYQYPAIVVEASMADILAGARFSEVHPNAAIGSLISWSVRYRVPVWLAGDRRTAAATVRKILMAAVKEIEEGV